MQKIRWTMRCFLIIVCVMLCSLFTGCTHSSWTIENAAQLAEYTPYEVPVKFYVRRIDLTSCPYSPFAETEEARWKAGLQKYWPHLFSSVPGEKLTVSLTLIQRAQWDFDPPAGTYLAGLLSLGTLGLLPYSESWGRTWDLKIQIEDIVEEKSLNALTYQRGNFGILSFLKTRKLLPEQKDSFAGIDRQFGVNAYKIREDRLKDFLQIFVAALHSFQREKIQELYLARKTKMVKFLE